MEKLKNKVFQALRWSERYTKTDMVYLAKGGFWLTTGYGFQIITGLILSIAFANLLSKEAFGTYQFIISMGAVVGAFTLSGMGVSVMRASTQDKNGSLRYASRTQLRWSIGILVVGLALAGYYYVQGNAVLAIAMIIISVFQPIIYATTLYHQYLLGKSLFKNNVILSILERTLPFVALIGTLLLTKDPLIIVLVYFVSWALATFLGYKYVVMKNNLPITPDNEMRSYAKHLSVIGFFTTIASQADKILVWKLLGAAPMAIYTLAQMPVIHIQAVFGLTSSLTFPKIAKKSIAELRLILPDKIRRYSLGTLLAVVAYILAAPFIFKYLFPNYLDSVIYSQVLALAVLAMPRTLLGQVFTAHEKKKELYILNTSEHIIRIILLVVLLPFYGIWGVVFALLSTELLTALTQTYLFNRLKN